MLIAVVGATGTGKSELALDLAESLRAARGSAEIVNGDAMQLYRGMDIGTAKVPASDRRGIPHHLLDVLEVTDEASVADYQTEARARIDQIEGGEGVPILVGGSGLYISAVLHDLRFPGTDPVIRARLEADLVSVGPAALHDRLVALDPPAAASIGPSNGRRLVRALEVIEITGEPFGAGLPRESVRARPTVVVGLTASRDQLVRRLDERVHRMWRAGLVDEVESLLQRGIERGATASRAIGYSQAIDQLAGRITEREAIERTQALTRRFARRQVGWFGRYSDVRWFEHNRPDLASAVLAHSIGG